MAAATTFYYSVLFASLNLAFQNFFSYSKLISYVFFAFIGLYYVSISYIFLKNDLWNRNASIIQVQVNLLIKNWSVFLHYMYAFNIKSTGYNES
jgi:hypothetical protein